MVQGWNRWSVAVLGAVLASLVGPEPVAAQQTGGDEEGDLLMLVTERVESEGEDEPEVGYWWANPAEPRWTATDRALEEALGETGVETMAPSGEVRISRIYRTPDLSLDNAASLASLLGARRVVVGEVVYRPASRGVLPGYEGMRVEGRLRVVDVASSEPSVLRTLDVERSVYAQARNSKQREDDRASLRERVERRFSSAVGRLLERTVAAAAGDVGLEDSEPLLAFRNLRYGRALELVREFLVELDTVSGTRVRWGSEGRIALEINPGARDAQKNVDYAARTLVAHDFDQMTIRRREERGDSGSARLEFVVELAESFEPTRRRAEDGEDDE